MRKIINDTLKRIYPVYPISKYEGMGESSYLVLKMAEQSNSINNSFGIFAYFEVLVYVSGNSVAQIDSIIEKVVECLKDIAECTGRVTPDYYDDKIYSYMRSVEFRISKSN